MEADILILFPDFISEKQSQMVNSLANTGLVGSSLFLMCVRVLVCVCIYKRKLQLSSLRTSKVVRN